MTRRIAPLGCLLGVSLTSAAYAQPNTNQIRAVLIPAPGFDLAAHTSSGERLQPLVERQEWRQSNVPQARWAYRPAHKGPELEVAAFGAGNKDMPSLAHVGVDWSF